VRSSDARVRYAQKDGLMNKDPQAYTHQLSKHSMLIWKDRLTLKTILVNNAKRFSKKWIVTTFKDAKSAAVQFANSV